MEKNKPQWILLPDLQHQQAYDIHIAVEYGSEHSQGKYTAKTAEISHPHWGINFSNGYFHSTIKAYKGQKIILPGVVHDSLGKVIDASWKLNFPVQEVLTFNYLKGAEKTFAYEIWGETGFSYINQYHFQIDAVDQTTVWIIDVPGLADRTLSFRVEIQD